MSINLSDIRRDPLLVGLNLTSLSLVYLIIVSRIVSKYDQEIPQSQTADKPMALRGRATQQSRDNRKTNKVYVK